jgi:hypothetical protein
MTDIDVFVQQVHERVLAYPKCSREQGLVYACEDVVDTTLGSPVIDSRNARDFVDAVCHRQDLDPPEILRGRSQKMRATANFDSWSICVQERNTTTSVLLHEIAHLSVGVDSHGVLFRDELVRLMRAHASVEHAALLHSLFLRLDLDIGPWGASAHQK